MTIPFSNIPANNAWTVDRNHPAASDENPGTRDAPFLTLGRAVKALSNGDTVRVMPGVYPESITLDGLSNVSMLAEGGPVVLEGGTVLTAGDVEAADLPGVFRWTPAEPLIRLGVNRPAQNMAWVFLDGERLILKREPLTAGDRFHFNRESGEVLMHLGAEAWPENRNILVAHRRHGFLIRNGNQIRFAGFELRHHAANAIELEDAADVVIEDCHIFRPNMHGVYMNRARSVTFRRNRVFEPNAWGSNFKGQGHMIEENMFQTSGTRNEPAAETWVGVLKFNGGSYHTIRHNFIADRPASETELGDGVLRRTEMVFGGIWGDVHCYANRIYGNSVARVGHTGIYLEYMTNHTTVMWNTVQDSATGISTRLSSNNLIRQNWIFDTAALWGREAVDFDNMPTFRGRPLDHPEWARERLDGIALLQTAMHPPHPPSHHNIVVDNLIQTIGRPVNIPVPSRMDAATRADVARYSVIAPEDVADDLVLRDFDYKPFDQSHNSPLNNLVDRNRYVWDPGLALAGFAWYLDGQIDSFEAYREATGLDPNGALGDFTPADIGLNIGWTLQPDSRKPDLPMAFDFDGGAERAVPVAPAVWGRGVWLDDMPDVYSWHRAAKASTDPGPAHRGRLRHESDWHRDARQWTRAPAARTGMRALGVINPAEPGGLGWRTPSIPVTAGQTMNVSAHLQGNQIVPANPEQGVEAVAVFTDWTGNDVQRVHLVGNGAGANLVSGTYDWTEVGRAIEVPVGAARMFLYFGLHPATGSLLIDDVHYSMALPETKQNRLAATP